jgi:cytochrome P450
MDDDVYRGMLIPKGSLVIANIRYASAPSARFILNFFPRGMSLNESVYSDPTRFYPESFLPKPAGRGEPYFNNTVFGFGRRFDRRLCPARFSDSAYSKIHPESAQDNTSLKIVSGLQ